MNVMNYKRYILETVTLVGAAALCAFVANQAASRERRLALPGNYKDATTVPAPRQPATGSKVAETQAPTPSASRPVRTAESAAASPSVASPAAAATPEPLTKRFPPHPDKPFVDVAGDDVIWLHARGALVLDARRTSVFSEGHIAAARPFSVWEADIDEKVLALINEGRSQREPIVVYCAGGDCEDSHMLSQKLFGAGFDNVLVYHDGWPDWQKRGGKSRTGAVP